MSTPGRPAPLKMLRRRDSCETFGWEDMVTADVHDDELMTMYSYLFLLWRIGNIVLMSSSTRDNAPSAPAPVAGRSLERALDVSVPAKQSYSATVDVAQAFKGWVVGSASSLYKRYTTYKRERFKYSVKIVLAITAACLITIIPQLQDRFGYSFWAAVRYFYQVCGAASLPDLPIV